MIGEITLYNTITEVAYLLNNDNATFLITDGSIDWGSVTSTHNTFSYPNQIGSYLSSTNVGSRTVTIFGWIVGGKEGYEGIKRKKKLLNSFINPTQPIEVRVGKYQLTGSPDTQVKYSNIEAENNDVMCKFLISLFCANPLFRTIDPLTVFATTTTPKFKMPLLFSAPMIFGEIKSSVFTDVTNKGVLPVGGIIRFEAKGTVNNPTLYNANTLEFIKINAIMTSGQVIEVSTVEGDRYIKLISNGVTQNFFPYLDLDSSWLQFSVGIEVVGFSTGVDNVPDDSHKNLTISISYHPITFNLEEE